MTLGSVPGFLLVFSGLFTWFVIWMLRYSPSFGGLAGTKKSTRFEPLKTEAQPIMAKLVSFIASSLFLAAACTASAQVPSASSNSGGTLALKPSDVRSINSLIGAPQGAGIIRVTAADFTAGSGRITFSEFPLATNNPVYPAASYGGGASSPTVTFQGFFAGQSLGTAATCPTGAALTGCVVGAPTNPLTLLASSPNAFIQNDGSNPTSPILSGTPLFNGAIAMHFSSNQAAVGLDGGFFNAVGGTAITAFRRDGTVIGSVSNIGTGIEFLGLATADRTETIAGLLFSLVGAEPAGFAIDNVRFGTSGQITGGTPRVVVAAPANNPWALGFMVLAIGLMVSVAVRRR